MWIKKIFALNSDRKRILLWPFQDHFLPIFAIFHKTEIQEVILRCLTGRNLNWYKSHDTKCLTLLREEFDQNQINFEQKFIKIDDMDRLLCIEKAQDRAILPHQQIPIIKIGSSLSVKRFHNELKSLSELSYFLAFKF